MFFDYIIKCLRAFFMVDYVKIKTDDDEEKNALYNDTYYIIIIEDVMICD